MKLIYVVAICVSYNPATKEAIENAGLYPEGLKTV